MANIKEVAKLAGVSIATVSRTLSKPESVAESTRDKVNKAIQASGYVTNALASNFRRRRSNNVIVLVPDISNPFFSEIIQGIESTAANSGYRILLGDTQNSADRERSYAELISQKLADGLIALGKDVPFEANGSHKKSDAQWPPIVMACEYGGELELPTVVIDNELAAQEMVAYLIKLGHRDIAFINGPTDSFLSQGRLAGFRQALQEHDLPFITERVMPGDFTLAAGYEAGRALLSVSNRPTALFCANDEMAIGAMNAARDLGLSVPEDISIAGFDDIDFASFSYPPLTTVHQPRRLLGERAMTLMLAMLGGQSSAKTRIVLPHELVIRGSTAAPVKKL